ncbi:MAG: acetyl-CoA C-acyltransferase [Candidatus Eremiobacteraeota bacterium]|nr:acetyl-CoA C-acyltransferase [Candidatus Eremiobacteraeota bacterium]
MLSDVWVLPARRTVFAKSDGPLRSMDAIALSLPVVAAMMAQIDGGVPDFAVWGTVLPNLTWSNIAREVLLDAGLGAHVPAFSTVLACSTSMMGAIEAAGMLDDRAGRSLAMVGGSESLSRVQIGLSMKTSDWMRSLLRSRGFGGKARAVAALRPSTVGLFVPSVANRTTGKSMGEHMEETVARMGTITRDEQDRVALESHRNAVAAWQRGFFDDLIVPVAGVTRDTIPRSDTSLEKLAKLPPAFDRAGGTITAGNSSPLTDGAAGVWIASAAGAARLPSSLPRVRLLDWEIAAVDIREEGLLMAPVYAIPRLLQRNGLRYEDVALWEIHEAFAAQVVAHVQVLERKKEFGAFPRERINPNGGTIALGHPFGATGARIMSQAAKELAAMPVGSRAIVSICADGGEGSVALFQAC